MGDKTMRYFLDFEFLEDGHTIDPVSLGITCEDGRELYIEFDDVDWSKANDWVLANVKPHLWQGKVGWSLSSRADAAAKVEAFVGTDVPEFWSWCAAYDWVALCQLYGPMVAKPAGWPNYCRDLQQEMDRLGVADVDLPAADSQAHHALADARWHRHIRLYLTALERYRQPGSDREEPTP